MNKENQTPLYIKRFSGNRFAPLSVGGGGVFNQGFEEAEWSKISRLERNRPAAISTTQIWAISRLLHMLLILLLLLRAVKKTGLDFLRICTSSAQS